MQIHTLQAKHIAKAYKHPVVKDVSFMVKSGEVVVLLGPNGAGKTTTFHAVVGLVRQDSGQILIDDIDISDMSIHKRAQMGIGYLPQEISIFRQLSVRDNIMAILELRKDLNAEQREQEL